MSKEIFKFADDVLSGATLYNRSTLSGFNKRISGESYTDAFRHESEIFDRSMHYGWKLADRMIENGRLFYWNLAFHSTHEGCGRAFYYGGYCVCNECGKSDVEKDWWRIKVKADGNEFMCNGVGFEDLQISNNYAFGKTKKEAIKNYGDLMIILETKQGKK